MTESIIAGSMGRTALPSRSRALSAGACGYTGKGDCVDRSCGGENSLGSPGGLSVSMEEKQEDSCQCQGDAGSGSWLPVFRFKDRKDCARKRKHALKLGKGGNVGCPRTDPSKTRYG